jgi:hypothetical protein
MPKSQATARTGFDWAIYADATFAGLSLLIPIPFVDSAFEWFFKRRMPQVIAGRRGQRLRPEVVRELVRGEGDWLQACLLLPVWLTVQIVKRLSRKVLYFLTIKDATDRLSFYWHQAFLLDYALEQGHLADLPRAQAARQAVIQALRDVRTSPLTQLAGRMVAGIRVFNVFRLLRRARRGQEDETITRKKPIMAQAWEGFAGYLGDVAVRYDQAHARVVAAWAAAAQAAAAQRVPMDAQPTTPDQPEQP